jgi:hypothetical protein
LLAMFEDHTLPLRAAPQDLSLSVANRWKNNAPPRARTWKTKDRQT